MLITMFLLQYILDLFEGDILLTPDVTERLQEFQKTESTGRSSPNGTQNNAIRDRKGLWVTKIVPYELPENLKGILYS